MERRYETVWIVRSDLGPEGTRDVLERARQALEKGGGRVNKVDEWGVKRLAYPIQKRNEGFYTLMDFNAEPTAVREMEKVFRYTEEVMRYQTVRLDEEYVEPGPAEAAGEAGAGGEEEAPGGGAAGSEGAGVTEPEGPSAETAGGAGAEEAEKAEEGGEDAGE